MRSQDRRLGVAAGTLDQARPDERADGAGAPVLVRDPLDRDLRLGEGTGAALAMPLLRAAAAVMREMATFAEAGVSRDR